MSSQVKVYYTPDEYLALERKAEYKSEYFDGEIFAMTGASRRHNLVSSNVLAALHSQLKKRPCEIYPSDMRVKVSPTGLYTYPDVVIVCGEPLFDDEQGDTLLNPTALVEVLSKFTASYDRGEKFEHYRKIESLAEYLVLAQDKYHVEQYTTQPGGQWLLSETDDPQKTIHLSSIECDLALSDIYDKVEIDR
ncbi:MAG TPA: Uma2 family endonuclease [Pyrinomonadaceae bacterium]|jgi:Uma2 family endonuclease|nr:Uma2 family endonuclease [Pyrinomonadaceae bacterium]